MIRELFPKFQKELVAFANTQYGRNFVSQFGGKKLKEDYPIVKVTPDGIHQKIDKNTYRAVFYPRSPYVKLFAEVLTLCDIAQKNGYDSKRKDLIIPHYMGVTKLLRNELPIIYLDSTTFNPNANPESTSVDGLAARTTVNEAWATIRVGAGSYSEDLEGANRELAYTQASATTDQYQKLYRSFFLFDTSALTTGAIISSAIISFYVGATPDNALGSNGAIAIVNTTPGSNTAIQNNDYDSNTGTTQQATNINIASISSPAYNDFTLNATGLGNVNKTGITKFGGKLEKDRANTAPTWASAAAEGVVCNYADSASNKPKLVVTYTVPGFLAIL